MKVSMLTMLVVWAIFCFLTVGGFITIKIYLGRRKAKTTRPQKGEVWTQDGEMLLIRAVAKHGVMIMAWPDNAPAHTWWDSWDEWDVRVHTRLIFRTNQFITLPE